MILLILCTIGIFYAISRKKYSILTTLFLLVVYCLVNEASHSPQLSNYVELTGNLADIILLITLIWNALKVERGTM